MLHCDRWFHKSCVSTHTRLLHLVLYPVCCYVQCLNYVCVTCQSNNVQCLSADQPIWWILAQSIVRYCIRFGCENGGHFQRDKKIKLGKCNLMQWNGIGCPHSIHLCVVYVSLLDNSPFVSHFYQIILSCVQAQSIYCLVIIVRNCCKCNDFVFFNLNQKIILLITIR